MIGALRYAASHAQVRARRSSLLAPPAWRRLRATEGLEEVASRLDATRYGPGVPRSAAALGRHLKTSLAAEAAALAAPLWGLPQAAVRAYARRYEIANLKTVLRCHHFGIAPERGRLLLLALPASSVAWPQLLDAAGVAGVADALAGTAYERPLRTVLEQGAGATPFALEVALDLSYFQHLVAVLARLRGPDAAAARRTLGSWIAVENLSWAFRYRVLAGLTAEETINYTLHRAFGAGLEAMLRVATGATVAEEAARLGYEVDPSLPVDAALAALELTATRRRVAEAEAAFARGTMDLGCALAHLVLADAEARDIVALAEGRALGLDDASLAARFVGTPASRGGP